MLDRIISSLKATGITNYIITETITNGAELYFIRRKTDMRRIREITDYTVTVYRDFGKDGGKMRGEATFSVPPGITAIEIQKMLADGYRAAGYVNNPYFELYGAVPGEGEQESAAESATRDGGASPDPEKAALRAAAFLFSADNGENAFINSAEIFADHVRKRIVSSSGPDVSYEKDVIRGEFVAQCREPQDVEQYFGFEYDVNDAAALSGLAEKALATVRDRSGAHVPPEAGCYDIILSGEHVRTLLGYFVGRSSAQMIYPGYSDWKPGTEVQGNNVEGERLRLIAVADAPYSPEGIPMKERTLLDDGKLVFIHGPVRQSRYIGAGPTGGYRRIRVENTGVPLDELRKGCLHPVSFSDFQLDPFTGAFGGEIRLAYYYSDGGVKIYTGGSVNGNIKDVCGNMLFSSEKYSDAFYSGPYALKLKGVRIAGA